MKLTIYTILISICAAVAIEGLNLITVYPIAILLAVPASWIPARFRPAVYLVSGIPMGAEGACCIIAGIAYLFNAPLAAIILAFETFLLERTLRNLLLVILSAVTGAVLHYLYRGGDEAVFMVPDITMQLAAVPVYIISGAVIGLIGYLLSKINKLKIPLIAGIAVIGALGWWMPDGLGNGYVHIEGLLTGRVTLQLIFGVCLVRLLMLAIANAAGITGSPVTPLLLIGSGLGLLCSIGLINLFPNTGMIPATGAILGMAAMLSGSLRIWLAAIILALEATHQWQLCGPLLCAVTPAAAIVWLFE